MSYSTISPHRPSPGQGIFITAQDDDSVRQRASRIPNSVNLRKPVVGTVLLEAIRSLLSR